MQKENTDIIHAIVQDSPYNLSLFSEAQVQSLNKTVHRKTNKNAEKSWVQCLIRKKSIQLKYKKKL